MIVVGLTGYKGAGKDAVADILVRDYGFTKMAFAEPIKEKVEILDPLLGHHVSSCCGDFSCPSCEIEIEDIRLSDLLAYGMTQDEIKRDLQYGPELRRVWQVVGTEMFRADNEDYWVDLAYRGLHETTAERVVFTDVRFENEADLIYGLREDELVPKGSCPLSSVWRIARPGVTAGEHSSEQLAGLLEEEVTILNAGSLEDLEEPVALAMDMLLKGIYPGQQAFDLEGKNPWRNGSWE